MNQSVTALMVALTAKIDRLTAERDQARGIAVALEQQVAAVAALHVPSPASFDGACAECGAEWPCSTICALDGEP